MAPARTPRARPLKSPNWCNREAMAHSDARRAPSSILSAIARPLSGSVAAKTPSAPVFTSTAPRPPHQPGTEAVSPGHDVWIGGNGGLDAVDSPGAAWQQVDRPRRASHCASESRQRYRKCRHAAAVGGRRLVGQLRFRQLSKDVADASLDRMRRPAVTPHRLTEMSGGRQHRDMFSGTVVVPLTGLLPGANEIGRRRPVERRMSVAFEVVFRQADAGKPCLGQRGVHGFTAMRGAGECQLGFGDRKSVGRAGFDKCERL